MAVPLSRISGVEVQDMMKAVARALRHVARVALWLAAAGLILMTVFITAQVVARYIFNDSLVWSEPAAVILMGWFIFLGAAVGIREGYHLSFDVLLYFLPETAKLWLYSISDLVVVGFGFGMVWFGSQLALSAWDVKLPSLGISGAFDFLPIVGGGVLVVLFSLERLARRAAGMPTARFGEADLVED
ncbi:TRAP-type C4-dicarboxylate transport system, small permease component [Hoeflea phototrophica DFL-43]|jgi:TRAP-type C4-dicarboxylate transport system permease small subunit|uniref:TRAP transporter small permease protein n=1 Tax=Hoeflea phototrophica (strain DSM 17068 / NCIMB 14078 / DFL-43) TaxID=411684 RepID=A9D2N3_HOEPD|nr:TRAP transporter small permease [Hoeflea phototrophica]EDQ34241.1 TRAP-type C4-dicarboxylate transport system, small permease component [Hoeflea phototrophica DFL-43]